MIRGLQVLLAVLLAPWSIYPSLRPLSANPIPKRKNHTKYPIAYLIWYKFLNLLPGSNGADREDRGVLLWLWRSAICENCACSLLNNSPTRLFGDLPRWMDQSWHQWESQSERSNFRWLVTPFCHINLRWPSSYFEVFILIPLSWPSWPGWALPFFGVFWSLTMRASGSIVSQSYGIVYHTPTSCHFLAFATASALLRQWYLPCMRMAMLRNTCVTIPQQIACS